MNDSQEHGARPAAPAAGPAARSAFRGSAFAPLRRPVFRALWAALIVSGLGSWMHEVGAGWLMAGLAPEPFMVSLVQAAAQLPLFLLTIPAGAMADIVDRRQYLIATQLLMMTTALTLGLLTLSGLVTAPLLVLFTFLMGSGVALMMPAFSALIPDLVPREELTAAITLNSIAFNAMRAVGPATAGAILAITGPGIVFLVNAVTLSAVIVALWRYRPAAAAYHVPAERFLGSVRTGLRYVRQSQALHTILLRGIALFVPMSAPLAFLPLIVRRDLGAGPEVYGILLGSVGAGAVLAGLQLARLRRVIPADMIIRAGTVGVVIANIALAFVSDLRLLGLAMLLLGASWIAAQSTLQVTTQLSLPQWVRARGLAVFMAVFMGVLAFGAPAWGRLASLTSIETALSAAAAAGLLGMLLTWRLSLNRHTETDTAPAEPMPVPELPAHLAGLRGAVMVQMEWQVADADRAAFLEAMREVRRMRLRNGAESWGLYEDPAATGRFVEMVVEESWEAHLRQHYRITRDDRRILDGALAFHRGERPPAMKYFITPPPEPPAARDPQTG